VGNHFGPNAPTVLYALGATAGGVLLAEKSPWAGRMLVASGVATGVGTLLHWLTEKFAPPQIAKAAAGLVTGRMGIPGMRLPQPAQAAWAPMLPAGYASR
jgi:hypothetical protein